MSRKLFSIGRACLIAAAVVRLALTAAGESPESYLLRVEGALEASRADVPGMAPVADAAAQKLAAGGKLYAAGQPSMVSELDGRAGGFMLLDPLGDRALAADDVLLYFPEGDGALPEEWIASGALTIVIGMHVEGPPSFVHHAAATEISPTLANAIPGWLFTGELIAALTRLGKMPVLYESIGMYQGMPRIEQFERQGVFWHEEHTVPAIAAGTIANTYIDTVKAILRRVDKEQRGQLDRAGAWVREAKAQGTTAYMYSMGHLFPDEVEKTAIGTVFQSAVWNAGFRMSTPPDHRYVAGDAIVHIGYQHPPRRLLDRAIPAGATVSYVSIRPDRDYANRNDVVWIDPMWPWEDAVVPLEGYDVPALAASGIVNGAIAWEIYRLSTEAPAPLPAEQALEPGP